MNVSKHSLPEYITTKSGEDHSPSFKTVIKLTLNGKLLTAAVENGINKKESEQLAAKKMISTINLE
ncbi:hypothetical protein A3715_18525 [Oleiphilus sp. HI0009]|nr:hypothetical protein A3715_18525 [Oleiphilus sp. HI0009]